jgi:hypothetical protein
MIPKLYSQDEMQKIIEGFEWSIQNRDGGKERDGIKPCRVWCFN